MNFIKDVLPTLATALGGPLAGIAAAFFGEKLGLEDKTVSAVTAAISGATPEQLVQMKMIDAELQKYFAGLEIDLEKIAQADRSSAREREAKTGDSTTPRVLATVIVGGFLSMVYMVLSGYVAGLKDPTIAGMIGTLIGYVSAKADQVVSYYFGSTAGSAAKTAAMVKAAKKE